jgi:hypothetical protein
MARVPYLVSVLTAGVVLAASPLASATSNDPQMMSAQAQTPAMSVNMLAMEMCGERNQVLAELDQQFREKPMAVGQVDGSAVVEILVSESGTWTILATGTDGKSCIVSAGEGFESTTLVRGVDA